MDSEEEGKDPLGNRDIYWPAWALWFNLLFCYEVLILFLIIEMWLDYPIVRGWFDCQAGGEDIEKRGRRGIEMETHMERFVEPLTMFGLCVKHQKGHPNWPRKIILKWMRLRKVWSRRRRQGDLIPQILRHHWGCLSNLWQSDQLDYQRDNWRTHKEDHRRAKP